MSIKVMSNIWDQSEQKGGKLLLLLAIADHADDYAFAWPSISTLAEKIRMSERHTRRMLQELEEDCELYIDRRGYSNRYIVTVGMLPEALAEVLEIRLEYEHDAALQLAERFFGVAKSDEDNQQEDKMSSSEAGKQGDKMSEDGDIHAEHEDVCVRDGDILSEHGDMGVPLIIRTPNKSSRESSEPSEPSEPSGNDDPPPTIDPKLAALISLYETEIGGTLTATTLDSMTEMLEMCQDMPMWRQAIKKSQGKRYPMRYAFAIIRNQQERNHDRANRSNHATGAEAHRKGAPNERQPQGAIPSDDDIAAWFGGS